MATITITLGVGIILVDDNPLSPAPYDLSFLAAQVQNTLPRLIVDDQVSRVGALGRRVFGVGMIHIISGAIGQNAIDKLSSLTGLLSEFSGRY